MPVPLRRSVAACCLAALLSLAAACSSAGPAAHTDPPRRVATTTTVLPNPVTKTYGVGRKDIVLVDTSRGTPIDKATKTPAKDDRTLPTVILYPTDTKSDDGTMSDHPVSAGRFSLVVFSHGVTSTGPAYIGELRALAAHGYVVALPTFPLTSGPDGWANVLQVAKQPGDVSFIVTELLAQSRSRKGLLAGHLDPHEVAAAGHSLGAITSLYFENSCCRDSRIKAVVSISGIFFPVPSESHGFVNLPSTAPLLLLHGKKDKTLPYESGSAHIFSTLTKVPRALVTFPDRGHVDVILSPSLMPSIVAFLDMELRHDDTRWRALPSQLAKNGDASIKVAGGLASPS